jgi:hypothetical protein
VHQALEQPATQYLGVFVATIWVASLHWQNDGLWYQGDAPRHAANGLFFWDLLTAFPTNPLQYALSYYARYPIITPVAYPPLFYLPEGFAYWLFGPSPYVAKVLVLICGAVAGLYAAAWARRWIADIAGWAGVCIVLLPGFVRFSNAVLLNVPATALGIGALYHFRRWLETPRPRDLRLFTALTVASLLTYYPSAIILPVAFVWILWSQKRARPRALWFLAGGLLVLAIFAAAVVPVYFERHAASLESLIEPRRWRLFYRSLIAMTGTAWSALAVAGLLAGSLSRERRRETTSLALAYLTVVIGVLLLRWLDIRYFLILGPITVLIAFNGVVTIADLAGRWRPAASAGVLAMLLVLATYSARSTAVPVVSGFDRVAMYLREHAPLDSVLYRGQYDGVLGFYLRAFDPRFERRMVLWRKLFDTGEDRGAFGPPEVVRMVQTRSGSRWFGIEVSAGPPGVVEKLLLRTLAGPEFELARSFQVEARGVARVDLYRFKLALDPPPPLDLTFGNFSSRVFRAVDPIPSRR